jgi:hypothetical protein
VNGKEDVLRNREVKEPDARGERDEGVAREGRQGGLALGGTSEQGAV